MVGGLNPGAVKARGTKNPQTICECSGRDCPSQSAADPNVLCFSYLVGRMAKGEKAACSIFAP
jgi:hypothetical protein